MAVERPLSGWVPVLGLLQPGVTAAAYAARGQRVKGACRAKGCSRRVDLDPADLCGEGFGRLTMTRIQRFWKCQRLDGCELSFHDEPPDFPLCLGHLVGRAHVRIRLGCRAAGCKFFRVWRVEEMAAGLRKRSAGDERTPVVALPGLMKSPCPLCGKVNWRADVLWANTDSVGWRTDPEDSFNRIRPMD